MTHNESLLRVLNLSVAYKSAGAYASIVKNVSFVLERGQTLAIVGESGSGKSSMAMAIAGLLPPAGAATGQINLEGNNLLAFRRRDLEDSRGNDIAVIFQNPMTSLNPTMRVGKQIGEQLRRHRRYSAKEAKERTIGLLQEVMIHDPEGVYRRYPHELSGGMKQRVMIAMAISCEPKIIIADEPTTALDVTVQAEILQILRRLSRNHDMGLLLVTHDVGVVAQIATDVAVVYDGHMVEYAPVEDLFREPLHPYTRGLLESHPRIDDTEARTRRLPTIVKPAPALDSMVEGYETCETGTADVPGEDAGREGIGSQRFLRIGKDLMPVVRKEQLIS